MTGYYSPAKHSTSDPMTSTLSAPWLAYPDGPICSFSKHLSSIYYTPSPLGLNVRDTHTNEKATLATLIVVMKIIADNIYCPLAVYQAWGWTLPCSRISLKICSNPVTWLHLAPLVSRKGREFVPGRLSRGRARIPLQAA